MKRILPLVLIVALLPALLAVPARAVEIDSSFIDVLNFCTPDDSGDYQVSLSLADSTVGFTLPFSTVITYIESIFRYTGDDLVGVSLVYTKHSGLPETSLTVVKTGTYYRVYGRGLGNTTDVFGIKFYFADGSTSGGSATFKSVKVDTVPVTKYQMSAVGTVYDYSTSPATQTPITYQADNVSHTVDIYASSTTHNSFRASLVLYDWQKYDYVDVLMGVFCQNIASVDVQLGGTYVPHVVNTISSVDGNNATLFIVTVRIDLTGIDRTVSSDLLCQLTATTPVNVASSFSITNVTGSVITEVVEAEIYWWQRLFDFLPNQIDRIINALGGSGDASQVQDNIDSAVGELGDVQAVMDGVTRPALDSIDFDVSGMIDTSAAATYGNIFSSLIGNQYMTNIVLIAFILAAASFLLFGRR